MKRERKHYDRQFKLMLVDLVGSGKTRKEVSEEFDVPSDLVSRWCREFSKYETGSFSGNGNANMTEDQKEIARLKRDLEDARIERDILKKAIGIFSKGGSGSINS